MKRCLTWFITNSEGNTPLVNSSKKNRIINLNVDMFNIKRSYCTEVSHSNELISVGTDWSRGLCFLAVDLSLGLIPWFSVQLALNSIFLGQIGLLHIASASSCAVATVSPHFLEGTMQVPGTETSANPYWCLRDTQMSWYPGGQDQECPWKGLTLSLLWSQHMLFPFQLCAWAQIGVLVLPHASRFQGQSQLNSCHQLCPGWKCPQRFPSKCPSPFQPSLPPPAHVKNKYLRFQRWPPLYQSQLSHWGKAACIPQATGFPDVQQLKHQNL